MVFCENPENYVFEREKVSSYKRHALKPLEPSYQHFYAVKADKNVKFAKNFPKLLLWVEFDFSAIYDP